MNQMENNNSKKNKKNNNNSSYSLVFGRWPQTKIHFLSYEYDLDWVGIGRSSTSTQMMPNQLNTNIKCVVAD